MTAAAKQSPAPSLERLKSLVAGDLARTDVLILDKLGQDVALIEQIGRHILSAGGKRLRPTLVLAGAHLCGYEGDRHVRLAAAVEFLHTATLLHDDVVDESTMRRGTETANAIWSNQASVLVGDFLLSRAFQLMVADGSIPVLRLLSDASAIISQGEVMQLMASGDTSTGEAQYLAIAQSKTAALFSASTEIGAILMDMSDEKRKALATYGQNLGLAFQIVDDALDYSATGKNFGKSIGDDFREGKMTLPVIYAIEEGDESERAFWQRTIGEGERGDGDLAEAIRLIEKHRTVQRALDKASELTAVAGECLQLFPGGAARDALAEVLGFVLARSY